MAMRTGRVGTRLVLPLVLGSLAVVASMAAAAPRRHPGGGLPLDQLPPQVRAMREEIPGSTPVEWRRGNIAFHDSLVAAGDTTGFLYACAVGGLVEGQLFVQEAFDSATRALGYAALERMRAAVGPVHPEVTRALLNLSILESMSRENYRIADSLLVIAEGIQRAWYGARAAEVARVLRLRASFRAVMGDFDVADALIDSTVAYALNGHPPDSSQIVMALGIRSGIRGRQGDIDGGLALMRWAAAFYERAQPRSDRTIAIAHGILGSALLRAGRAGEGLMEMTRGQDYLLRHLGPDHFEMRSSEAELGRAYYLLGDDVNARRCFENASRPIRGQDPDHSSLLEPLVWLGALELNRGQFVEARQHLERAVLGYRREADPSRALQANALEPLAACLASQGNVDSALVVLGEAKALRQADAGALAYRAWPTLGVTEAGLWLAQRDTARASALLESLLDSSPTWSGRSAHVAWSARLALAHLRAARGESGRAFDLALEVERDGRQGVRDAMNELPERWALRVAALRESGFPLMADLLGGESEASSGRESTFLAELIRSRAVVLDGMAARRLQLQQHAASTTAPLWRRRDEARRRLREFTEDAVPGSGDGKAVAARLVLEREVDLAEADLARVAEAAVVTGDSGTSSDLADIRRGLSRGEALVSFVRLARTGSRARAAHYVAMVLNGDAAGPRHFDLGDADSIDFAIRAWRTAASSAGAGKRETGFESAGQRLRELVWDPLDGAIHGASRVYVVPDGALGLVQLGALPLADGSYLIEQGQELVVLSCERDLAPAKPRLRASGLPILAMGGVDYRSAAVEPTATTLASRPMASELGTPAAGVYRGPRPTCDQGVPREFAPLPASRGEVHDLLQRESGSPHGAAVSLLESTEATEGEFKRLAPRSRGLHLATHGFFVDPACAGGFESAARLRGWSTAEEQVLVDNPLTRCGLAFAGANRRWEVGGDQEDGILTGDEIASLDLSGVEFVVLSACNSGMGDVLAGEGVLGLQRAFRIAGAGPIVMSLWPVEDQLARRWMRTFYAARLAPGVTTTEATTRASLAMLAERRRLGLSTRPSTWAPFMAVGLDR